MKLLFWVTTLNGEILAHLRYVLQNTNHQVMLATDSWDTFKKEAYYSLWPIDPIVVNKKTPDCFYKIIKFKPDTVIIDNHLPPFPLAETMFVIWHGYGWKGPQDRAEFASFFKKATRNVGKIDVPNPRFLWKAYGPTDYEQRIARMELPKENIKQLGMAAADDVINLKLNRSKVSRFYGFDTTKKNILIAPTWHYNEVFAHWGSDEKIFSDIFALANDMKANVIVRMHDKKRYSEKYVNLMQKIATKTQNNIIFKYKDEYTDNTVDMLISDVLVTNFSSIANPFYATLKPTVHIYPVSNESESTTWRQLKSNGVKTSTITKELLWKIPLTENGGDIAYSPEEMLSQIEKALKNPDIHKEKAKKFNDKYIYKCDGKTCERITTAIEEQVDKISSHFSILPPTVKFLAKPSFLKDSFLSFFEK